MKWLQWANEDECHCIEIEHPDYGSIKTFCHKSKSVYNSYSRPYVDEYGDVCILHFDHDEGGWEDSICVISEEYKEGAKYYL